MYLKEIWPNQPQSREDKNRAIGEDSLLRVLKLEPRLNDKRPFELTHRVITDKANIAALPTSLITLLGFEGLDWTWCGEGKYDSRPTLRIGKPHDNEPMTTDANKATATIEVASRVELSEGNKKIVPIALRMAGIKKMPGTEAPGQIVAGTWGLEAEDNYSLTSLNVSFSSSQFGHGKENIGMLSLLSKSIIPLTDSEKRPYFTAGLITPEMRKTVGADHEYAFSFRIDPHFGPLALRQEVLPRSTRRGYTTEEEQDIYKVQSIFKRLGYYTRLDGNYFNYGEVLEIGLKEENARLRQVSPWKIRIPSRLNPPIEKTGFCSPTEAK